MGIIKDIIDRALGIPTDADYAQYKEDWRVNLCIGKNQHFVGELTPSSVRCSVCGKEATITQQLQWTWD